MSFVYLALICLNTSPQRQFTRLPEASELLPSIANVLMLFRKHCFQNRHEIKTVYI